MWQQVGETLGETFSIVWGKFGRRIAHRVYGRYLLRVVFEEYEDYILVITAYPARPERYL